MAHEDHDIDFSEAHDAGFCRTCDVWLSSKCGDPNGCPYCEARPDKPSELEAKDGSSGVDCADRVVG
jgi:hypothetical protein